MWALVESDSVSKVYARPTAITIGFVAATYYTAEDEAANSEHVEGTLKTPRQGTNYPQNIFSLWTEAELKSIGIYPITMDKTNLKNGRYYSNTDITYTWDSDNETVTGAYGTATAQNLATLKEERKVEVNNTAGGLLDDYDWYTLRAASGGTAIPSSIATYQAAVRTKANSMCTQIDGAADVDALAALYVYNSDDPPVRPLGEWPNEPS